ncbi:MAG: glycoside hydrolase family 113, partial [Ktedonobacteraceae bacterium]
MSLIRGITAKSLRLLVVFSFFLLAACSSASVQGQPGPSQVAHTQPTTTSTSPLQASSSTPATPQLLRPDLERGMVYPEWSPQAYGFDDATWQQGVETMKQQTGATWVEMPVVLRQSSESSMDIGPDSNTVTLDAFGNGIQRAVSLGYHVFFVPLTDVVASGEWAGVIQYQSQQQMQTWFDRYWHALQPYAEVAQEAGAEQMSVGTELEWMSSHAPASLWNQLIANVQSVFKGTLTYYMNWWPSLTVTHQAPPSWFHNPALGKIGISEYIPLVDSSQRVDPSVMPALWKSRVENLIDNFAEQVGKPVILSEIGYRDTSDALYNPFSGVGSGSGDSQEQAAAYTA